ncbi:neprilysin-like isoform X2 [Temnothorax nylanderi]|uniref:neprilysin-like isoform X2 n=1 Tax=Temnothorax nylanderi TaxID=102681 RepID=UPI003A84AFD9
MRWFILLSFIGILFVKNATPSKNQKHHSRLDWLFGLSNKQDENKAESKPTVCQTKECKEIARIISESMDKSVDPCDDFYEYACGKWPEHNPIPTGMNSWSMFIKAHVNVQRQIKEILDEGPKDSDILAVKLAKKWYTVCMDTDAMERDGLDPLVYTLSRIGGWPLIMEPDKWNEEYSWQRLDDIYVHLTGRNAFHDINIPDLPPGSCRLLSAIDSEEEKYESDEDPNDEEKQSDEQEDSQEPGSKEKNNDKNGNNSNDGNEDDDNDDDEDDNNDNDKDNNNNDVKDDDDDNTDDDNDTNEQNDDNNAKKKVGIKKTGKLTKNKKLGHSRKVKSSTHSKKYENHKTKKKRIKRRAMSTNVHKKLRLRKTGRNRVKQERMERLKSTLGATTSQISTEETIDEDNELKQYANYILKVARAIAKASGIEVSEEHMNKGIQDIMEFQIKLANITMKSIGNRKMTLNDFQKWYDKKLKSPKSAIEWLYKIGELFDKANVQIDDELTVEIGKLDYFEGLVALLDKTSSRTIVNYIHWNFLSRIIRATTSKMRELYNVWEPKMEYNVEEVPGVSLRSRKCIQEVYEMEVILAYEYVRKHFSDEITTTASDMVDDIQKEVEYQIKKSNLMDKDTKDFVLAKLVNMDKFIGYPDWFKNNIVITQYFKELVISNSYFKNVLGYYRYRKFKDLRELLKKDIDYTMIMNPTMVHSFFSNGDNSIALSAANFQSPLFAYGRPQVINYAMIGIIMGHEVNHGFDSYGHLYDKNGNIVEWLSVMAEAYSKRAECFVEHFNNYPIDKTWNFKISDYGNQTARENIADTLGLEAAFRAYQRRQRECRKSAILPGHEDLTNDQLFFLSFANLYCEAAKMSSIINKAQHDPHSLGRLRVIGSVSNSQDFAEAYNCPIGSAMNPAKKCHIWK